MNVSFLARLKVAEKFVVGWWGGVGWWSRPSLGFSFSQAEQYLIWTNVARTNVAWTNVTVTVG